MSAEHSYQFTPFGILRGDQGIPTLASSDPMPAAVRAQDVDVERVVVTSSGTRPLASQAKASLPVSVEKTAARPLSGPLTGKQIAAQCKARIRELEKALRAVPAMQSELESLKRLLQAAAQPSGRVLSLHQRSNTGSGR